MSRFLAMSVVLATASFATIVSCGDDGGKSPAVDAPNGSGSNHDGGVIIIDGPNAVAGIGTACTPVAGNPQADCPTGYQCLSLQGGNGAWCSKTCTQGAGDTCNTGYTGPGLAACVYGVTPQGGGSAQTFCGIVCQAPATSCPATTCDGTCPTPLACTAPLMSGSQTVAHACQ